MSNSDSNTCIFQVSGKKIQELKHNDQNNESSHAQVRNTTYKYDSFQKGRYQEDEVNSTYKTTETNQKEKFHYDGKEVKNKLQIQSKTDMLKAFLEFDPILKANSQEPLIAQEDINIIDKATVLMLERNKFIFNE